MNNRFRSISIVPYPQDNPPGHFAKVAMHQDSVTICKSCFYVKRGSLGNMQLHDLIAHLNENADFADKCLNLHSGIF